MPLPAIIAAPAISGLIASIAVNIFDYIIKVSIKRIAIIGLFVVVVGGLINSLFIMINQQINALLTQLPVIDYIAGFVPSATDNCISIILAAELAQVVFARAYAFARDKTYWLSK